MKFIERIADDMFGPRDYWDLQNGFTAMVMEKNNISTISIRKERTTITEQILIKLQSETNYTYITQGYGIDAVFIKCPKDKLNDVLSRIEDICKTL